MCHAITAGQYSGRCDQVEKKTPIHDFSKPPVRFISTLDDAWFLPPPSRQTRHLDLINSRKSTPSSHFPLFFFVMITPPGSRLQRNPMKRLSLSVATI